ncbi:glycosyltransferase [bacterium]|nr:MAG: glycosyltransferase [bacterium]
MAVLITALYGLTAFTSLMNLLLMRRPPRTETGEGRRILCLIPARDEEENLRELIPILIAQGARVAVFNDESSDRTGEVAEACGATVITPPAPLPAGWTGKNRACHELGKWAETTDAELWLFLDADVRPQPGFLDGMAALARSTPVVSGIPRIRPGRGVEPLFMAWIGWIILANNPFWIVSLTGLSHNRFLNGQVTLWHRDVYTRLWPNETMKGRIMEDVMMGRLLGREKVPVTVADLSRVLDVHMYDHWRQTLDGFSKNAYEMTNSAWGTILVALALAFGGLAWVTSPLAAAFFFASALFVCLTARTPLWPVLFAPLSLLIGAYTCLRSLWWKKHGKTAWKGRTYS